MSLNILKKEIERELLITKWYPTEDNLKEIAKQLKEFQGKPTKHNIEKLILGMRPSKMQRRTSEGYVYTTDMLLRKIKSIEEQGKFRWANGNIVDTKELAGFLYKINFITARKKTANGIDRKYFEENRYLSNKFVDFGYDWEVHPAYRWALQPEDPLSIFNELELNIN